MAPAASKRDDASAAQIAPDVVAEGQLGSRLRRLRQARKWTLSEASKSTGVSSSALSKIERDELSPTVSTVRRIAQGYAVEVADLLSERRTSGSLMGRRSVTRAGEGRPYQSNSCANVLLCDDLLDKRMTPIRTIVTARALSDYDVWPTSDAEIFVAVIGGTLVVHTETYAPLTLSAGDTLYYDARSPHVWLSEGPEDAEVLWVITS